MPITRNGGQGRARESEQSGGSGNRQARSPGAGSPEATGGGRRFGIAGVLLVGVFVISRAVLVATSYDALANWEEPGILYSALEIGRHGLATIFDHQDDLSHGGSLVLLSIATPWVALAGTSLAALKGVAILWSTLTLVALLVVGTRYVSAPFGLILGLLYAGASPFEVCLQSTLVGSHPESILFAVLALGAYLAAADSDAAGGQNTRVPSALALGIFGGLAVWCSYLTAPLIASLVCARLLRLRDGRAAMVVGLGLGLAPWAWQNLWLRPHGALQWLSRVTYFRSVEPSVPHASGFPWHLVESFGLGRAGGAVALVVFGALAIYALTARRAHSGGDAGVGDAGDGRTARPAHAALAIAVAFLLTLVALWLARPVEVPGEGYYYARFFVPLHFELYWLVALGIERVRTRVDARAGIIAVAALLAVWVAGQAHLYGTGNSYAADLHRDRLAGCAVFGHAELDRAADMASAAKRLAAIPDRECAERAFVGYGWAMVSRYARVGDLAVLNDAIEAAAAAGSRAQACAGARQMLEGYFRGGIGEDLRTDGGHELEALCP